MVRLLTLGGVALELANAAVSWVADVGDLGLAGCLLLNVVLLGISIAYRVVEAPLISLTSLPNVLSVDDGPTAGR